MPKANCAKKMRTNGKYEKISGIWQPSRSLAMALKHTLFGFPADELTDTAVAFWNKEFPVRMKPFQTDEDELTYDQMIDEVLLRQLQWFFARSKDEIRNGQEETRYASQKNTLCDPFRSIALAARIRQNERKQNLWYQIAAQNDSCRNSRNRKMNCYRSLVRGHW